MSCSHDVLCGYQKSCANFLFISKIGFELTKSIVRMYCTIGDHFPLVFPSSYSFWFIIIFLKANVAQI
jgi:hypothetical protein